MNEHYDESDTVGTFSLTIENYQNILLEMVDQRQSFQVIITPISVLSNNRFEHETEPEVWEYKKFLGIFELHEGVTDIHNLNSTLIFSEPPKKGLQMLEYLSQKFDNASVTLRYKK